MNLMDAMSSISDEHITEFAYANAKRGRVKLFVKIASAVACLAVIITAAVNILPRIPALEALFDRSKRVENYSRPISPDVPRVNFNGKLYLLAPMLDEEFELPSGFEFAGEFKTDPDDTADHCNDGDKIYINPDIPDELYVYTFASLIVSSPGYRYVRFIDAYSAKYDYEERGSRIGSIVRVYMNNRWYEYDQASSFTSELPEGYALAGRVMNVDYPETNGYGERLVVGDKIYQNPFFYGDIYVYSNFLAYDEYCYKRLVDKETRDKEKAEADQKFDSSVYVDTPHVVFNKKVYLFDADLSETPEKLRKGIKHAGKVKTTDPGRADINGYSNSCNVGDKIYQDPDLTGELYVYTKAFSDEAKYVRFSDYETVELAKIAEEDYFKSYSFVIKYNDKPYCNVDLINDIVTELPEGYVLVENIDSEEKVISHDIVAHVLGNIGEKIYQKPGCPGEIYIYYCSPN